MFKSVGFVNTLVWWWWRVGKSVGLFTSWCSSENKSSNQLTNANKWFLNKIATRAFREHSVVVVVWCGGHGSCSSNVCFFEFATFCERVECLSKGARSTKWTCLCSCFFERARSKHYEHKHVHILLSVHVQKTMSINMFIFLWTCTFKKVWT